MDPTNGGGPDIQAIQQLTSALKEMGQYSRQLSEAINASAKNMEKMSDLAEAIGDQTKERVRNRKDESDLDDKTTRTRDAQLRREFEMLDVIVKQVSSKSELTASDEEILDAGLQIVNNVREVNELYSQQAKEDYARGKRTREHNEALKQQVSWFTKMADEASRTHDKLVLNNGLVRGLSSIGSTASHVMTGKNDAGAGIKQMMGSLASEMIPLAGGMGGLLGLMIAGKMKEAEWTATGQIAMQQFDQVGERVSGFGGLMTATARTLSVAAMASKEDIANVASALASTGITAEQAKTKIDGYSAIVGNNLVEASLAADKALEKDAGSFAKMTGVMAGSFNMGAKEAFQNLVSIAAAAKDAGMNAATFTQQLMDANGALRMLNANGESAGQWMLGMGKGMRGQGFNAAYSQQYATAGVSQATQGIAGMDVGLSAVIGERMGFGSGLDAWYAMKSGGKDATDIRGGKFDVAEVARELAKQAKEVSGNKSEQVYFLSQMGFGVQGAEAILDADKEMAANNGQLTKHGRKMLDRGLRDESDKTSEIEKHLSKIKDAFLNIGVGLLQMMTDSLKMIYHLLAGIAKFAFLNKKEEAAGHFAMVSDIAGDVTASAKRIGGYLDTTGKEFGHLLGKDFKLGGKWEIDPKYLGKDKERERDALPHGSDTTYEEADRVLRGAGVPGRDRALIVSRKLDAARKGRAQQPNVNVTVEVKTEPWEWDPNRLYGSERE